MTIKHELPINVNIGGSGSGSSTKKITLKTAGTYVDQDIEVTGTVTATLDSDASGSFTNTGVAGQTYATEDSANTIIPSGGALYINAGFFTNTKIDLAHMLPKDTDATNNAGVAHIRQGYEAFDVGGNRIVGTMANVTPSFSGGDVTINNITNKTSPTATISSTGTLKTATSYGVTTTKPSGTDGTNYFTIGGNLSVTSGSFTMNASRGKVTYGQAYAGYLNVASGATALSATTNDVTKNATMAVSTTDNFDSIYIPKATITEPTNSFSITNLADEAITYNDLIFEGNITTDSRDMYAKISASGSGSITKGITTAQSISSSGSIRIPLASAGVTAPVIDSSSQPTVTITGSVVGTTGVDTTGVLSTAPSTGKYLTVNGTYTANTGSVSMKSVGYKYRGLILSEDTNMRSSAKSWTASATVTNNAPKYIKVYDGSYEIT